jgi:hypothetical protein
MLGMVSIFFLAWGEGWPLKLAGVPKVVAALSQPPGKELLFEHPVNHPIHVDDLRSLRTVGGIKVVVSKSRWALLEMTISID